MDPFQEILRPLKRLRVTKMESVPNSPPAKRPRIAPAPLRQLKRGRGGRGDDMAYKRMRTLLGDIRHPPSAKVTQIQSLWRGYVARKKYRYLRFLFYS